MAAELLASAANEFVVWLPLREPDGSSSSSLQARLLLHAQYHAARKRDVLVNMTLVPPSVIYVNCAPDLLVVRSYGDEVDLEQQLRTVGWVPMAAMASPLHLTWATPVGSLEHLPSVAVITLLLSIFVTSLLFKTISLGPIAHRSELVPPFVQKIR